MKTLIEVSATAMRSLLRTRIFAALLVLLSQSLTVGATTYYFSTSGSDGNTGTSSGAPKQSLSAAAGLAAAGNTILFKRGDSWSSAAGSLNLQGKSGTVSSRIVFDAYGSGADPVISTLEKLSNSGWTRVSGTTTWQKSVSGYSDALRLYVSGASKVKVASETAVDQTYEWYIKPVVAGSSGIVYVNTGSTTVGPQNVEISPVGADSALKMKNTHYVTVQNLEFRGGSGNNVVLVEAESAHILFDNNTVRQGNFNGILVTNLGTATADYVSYLTVSNCTVDKVWSSVEDVPGVILTGDGIVFQHAVENAAIVNNVVKNWAHAGIAVVAYRSGFNGVHDITVEQNKITADQSGYMHAFEVYGYENGATGIIVRRNFCYDFTSTCHALGNGNKYYSNIFTRVRLTTLSGHSTQPYGIDMAPWLAAKAVPTDTRVWMVAHDNIVANNTFYDIDQYPIYMNDDHGSSTAVANNLFYNNLIINYGYPNPATTDVGMTVDPAVRGNTYVRRNNYWDGDASSPGTAKVIRYYNPLAPNYTAAELDTNFSTTCSDNHQLDPKLQDPANNVFNLTSASPTILKNGGLDISSLMDAGFVDYFGSAWDPTNPSIGAIQVP